MFKKLFKSKEKTPKDLLEHILQDLLNKGGFSLSFELTQKNETQIDVEIFGEDEGLLKTKQGRLLLALQTYLNKVIQHNFLEESVFIKVESRGFFKEQEEQLLHLADKLRQKAISSGRAVYLKRSLSPFQRRQVHQFLEKDGGVKSSSVGSDFYKNICITPTSLASMVKHGF